MFRAYFNGCFNDVTVGLFFKEPLLTVHSYSKIEGLENRLEEIEIELRRHGWCFAWGSI